MEIFESIRKLADDAARDAFDSLRPNHSQLQSVVVKEILTETDTSIGLTYYTLSWVVTWYRNDPLEVSVPVTEDMLEAGEEWLAGRLAEIIITQVSGVKPMPIIGKA